MIVSKLSTKGQTTIPQSVRTALGVREGDELVYQISGDRVTLSKRQRVEKDDPFLMFEEWDSEADRAAYANL